MTDQACALRAPQRSFAPSRPTGDVIQAFPPRLTPRQRECLIWVEQGKSSTDIAAILGLSSETVNEHVGEACRRLGVRTRVQAVVAARAQGLFA